jgi:hypothetical protein
MSQYSEKNQLVIDLFTGSTILLISSMVAKSISGGRFGI